MVRRDRIVPISESQDTAGVISKNVDDDALILSSIYGYDTNDKDTICSKNLDSILKNADVIVYLSNQAATAYAPAGYPALTVPAVYKSSGEPIGITFVGSKFEEGKLLKIANVYENNTKYRKDPNLKY